jgi:2-dehydropantoate 2-reductase
MALRRFAAVHGMCVMMPAAHLEPGVVEASSSPCTGILDVGLATGGHDAVDVELARALRASTFESEPLDDILRAKRTKLLLNLGNVLDAACGSDPALGSMIDAARAEGFAVLDAAGLTYAGDEEERARRADHLRMRPIGGKRRGGGSTWQSLARGAGRTEADYLNGEVVLLGRLHGVPTPMNAALQRLARHLAATGAPAGSMTPADVDAWLTPR